MTRLHEFVFVEHEDSPGATRLFRVTRDGQGMEWCYAVHAVPDATRARWYGLSFARNIAELNGSGIVTEACLHIKDVDFYFQRKASHNAA